MDEEEDPLANFSIADVSSDEADDSKQARRTGQSEEAWRAIQRGYKTKVENGDLPLEPGASKMDIQELLHAVEELYFFRRYHDAVQLAGDALYGSNGLDRDSRQLLATYQERCQKKLTTLA
ncbi:hypothetical protein NM208_g11084 [Fusarium decemcellulare]|uniref:Uncharacterized protein n=1 Tax=Fusarium decemcellulare TaxID=57161 RepID=A0ACC1RVL3_9HYPO|nr:hypothetical protein NM208_g11084 [Fusarium decemcellulare]